MFIPWSHNQTYFFFLTSGFQEVEIHEGSAPIWIQTRGVDLGHYYIIALYWASQVIGTLGLGDINTTIFEDLVYNNVALFIALLCRCLIMCR